MIMGVLMIDNNKDSDKQLELDWPEERMDIIGSNGNDGTHYVNDSSHSEETQPDLFEEGEGC